MYEVAIDCTTFTEVAINHIFFCIKQTRNGSVVLAKLNCSVGALFETEASTLFTLCISVIN